MEKQRLTKNEGKLSTEPLKRSKTITTTPTDFSLLQNPDVARNIFAGVDQRARADWLYKFRPNDASAILKRYAPWEESGAPWPSEIERAYQTFRARGFIAAGWSPQEALKNTGVDV